MEILKSIKNILNEKEEKKNFQNGNIVAGIDNASNNITNVNDNAYTVIVPLIVVDSKKYKRGDIILKDNIHSSEFKRLLSGNYIKCKL